MILHTINLILMFVLGITIAGLIRQYKIRKILKGVKTDIKYEETDTDEEKLDKLVKLAETRTKLEVVKKLNYLFW